MSYKPNFDVFDKGMERDNVHRLFDQGEYKMFPSVIGTMNIEKEQEVQRMVDELSLGFLDVESDVMAEMNKEQAQTGVFPIQTPEDEKKWQKKLDDERAARTGGAISTAEPKFVCEVCGRELKTIQAKDQHVKTHDKELLTPQE